MTAETIKICQRCNNPLDGHEITTYQEKDGELVVIEVYCNNCRIQEDYELFKTKRIVSSKVLMDLNLGIYDSPAEKSLKNQWRYPRFQADKETREELVMFQTQLELRVKIFEGKVWFDQGLRKFIKKQTKAGLSGHHRCWSGAENDPVYDGSEFDIRCFSMAGRFLITFETKAKGEDFDHPEIGTTVTFITDESSKQHCMGFQGVYGNTEDVLRLCDQAIYDWGKANWYYGNDRQIDFGLTPDEKVSII